MIKNCSRCKNKIECKANELTNCKCTLVSISKETTLFLRKTNYDCLCNKCLLYLNNLVENSQKIPFPKPDKLKEGLHYYMDEGLFVFSEFYHLSRGQCCKNNCKHCAYGYQA